MLERSGLPGPAGVGPDRDAQRGRRRGAGRPSRWSGAWSSSRAGSRRPRRAEIPDSVERADDGGIDRLFRTLVPVVTGRRSGHEIVHRLRRKWDLGHGLLGALERVRDRVHDLADLKGGPAIVLDRLGRDYEALAPDSVARSAPWPHCSDYGVDLDRVELDLLRPRHRVLLADDLRDARAHADGPVEVCGGGRDHGPGPGQRPRRPRGRLRLRPGACTSSTPVGVGGRTSLSG